MIRENPTTAFHHVFMITLYALTLQKHSLLTKFKDFDFFIAFHHVFMITIHAVTLQKLFY